QSLCLTGLRNISLHRNGFATGRADRLNHGVIGSDFEQTIVAQTPLGRIGQPDDIAGVDVFLASDDARWLSGERLSASGGFR
ncbi:SDR family oxidoreductase, partial [Rhizobium leguminosarum]|uniref:SDR family oxidoreductase n=1 Tax=Rhizobium leguminosarum TaxID=384 RepID=UPI003F9BEFBA